MSNDFEKFVNWLEGYLDASKNKLTTPQIKEIRKKISDVRTNNSNRMIPLWDSTSTSFPVYQEEFNSSQNNTPVDDEFLKEIERNKNASTMEELV